MTVSLHGARGGQAGRAAAGGETDPNGAPRPFPSKALLTALTTEHFTLQTARSQTASESASRASLYILSVSSALVALGFIGQASQIGTTFHVFALTVLPTLYVLGVFTFAWSVAARSRSVRSPMPRLA